MTRLYFTDPIKTLYMMKEFGVKIDIDKREVYENFDPELTLDSSILERLEKFGKIYVAKESGHIFELKDMDYGIVKRPLGLGFCQYSFARGYEGWNYINGGVCKEPVQIIMRDRKQFFQAENETI